MIITLAMQKGGSGKTATAAALAQAAAHDGKRVLCVDLDPQGNFSFTMGARMIGTGAFEFLTGSAAHTIRTTAPLIDVIPASKDLSALKTEKGSGRRLQKALEPIKDNYDFVIIDTPPTVGELQYNALQAADGVIIPILADVYCIQSLFQICETIKSIQKTNDALKVLGIVFTQYDGRSTLAQQMKQTITDEAEKMGVPVLGTIRAGVVIKEAAALQKNLFNYAPRSKAAFDYMAIYNSIAKRG